MASSLDDDLLEQDGGDVIGRHRGVDAARQLLLEPIKSGRAVEIGRAQLAQIRLEGVHNPGHQRLNLRNEGRVRQFEHDLDLEILSPVSPGVRQVDQDIRQIDKGRRLRDDFRFLMGRSLEEKIGPSAATSENQQTRSRR